MPESTQLRDSVCAVIVSYNIGPSIHNCVNSVRDQVAEVIVVDNGSGRATQDALDDLEPLPRVKVIRNPANEGIARALNQGVREAISRGHQWVLTLDHDSHATPDMVRRLLSVSRVAGKGMAIFAANPYDRNAGTFRVEHQHFKAGDYVEVERAISSGSLLNASLFKKIGFFNESLFVYYVDSDFSMRARKLNVRTYICPKAVLIHSEGFRTVRRYLWRSMPHIVYGKEAHYFLSRNAIYMLREYASDRSCCRSVRERLWTDFAKVILYDKQKVPKLFYRLRGLWDGVRGKYGPLR